MRRGTEAGEDKAGHTEAERERSARGEVILPLRDMSWFVLHVEIRNKGPFRDAFSDNIATKD